MKSMTGFGRGEARCEHAVIVCEAKSVNHRAVDVKVRVPSAASGDEAAVLKQAKGAIERGRLEVIVRAQRSAEQICRVHFQQEAAARLLDDLHAFAQARSDLQDDVSLKDLLGMPTLFTVGSQNATHGGKPDEAEALPTVSVLDAVEQALAALTESREAEGRAIESILRGGLERCQKLVRQIGPLMRESSTARQQDYLARIQELLGQIAVDPDRLAQEIAVLAERLDVTEELDRLNLHLERFDALLGSRESAGRKLDFLCQELLREANTIGSKCQNAQVAHLVVDLKAEIERLREQVQNVQ